MSTIRRSIEIDVLQNRKYTDSNCSISNDQTVFISSLDLTGEIVVLTNPTNKNVSIEKWSISDGKKLHTFVFPVNCVIHGNSTLNVYTCPGGEHNGGVFINPCVLWTNLDGTMRRKEVLNNDHCTMQLHNSSGKFIASCTSTKHNTGSQVTIQRGDEAQLYLPSLQLGFPGQITLGYLRLAVVTTMAWYLVISSPVHVICTYWTAFALDIAARGENPITTAKDAAAQSTRNTLSFIVDRLQSLLLHGSVLHRLFLLTQKSGSETALSENHTRFVLYSMIVLGAVTLLDLSSSFLERQTYRPAVGSQHRDLYAYLHGVRPELLTAISLGAEYTLLFIYTQLDTSSLWLFDLPPDAVSTFSDLGRYVYVGAAYWGLAAFVIKQVQSIGQICGVVIKV